MLGAYRGTRLARQQGARKCRSAPGWALRRQVVHQKRKRPPGPQRPPTPEGEPKEHRHPHVARWAVLQVCYKSLMLSGIRDLNQLVPRSDSYQNARAAKMLTEEKPYTLDDLSRARQALCEAEQRPQGDAHKWARLRLTVVECNLAAGGLLPHQ